MKSTLFMILGSAMFAATAFAAPAMEKREDTCLYGGDNTVCIQRGESSTCTACSLSEDDSLAASLCISQCTVQVQKDCAGCSS